MFFEHNPHVKKVSSSAMKEVSVQIKSTFGGAVLTLKFDDIILQEFDVTFCHLLLYGQVLSDNCQQKFKFILPTY